MANPAATLLLQGILSSDPPSAGYTARLRGKGPLTNFVEFLNRADADADAGPFLPNQPASYLVDLTWPLHFSDDPLTKDPTQLPPRPIVPVAHPTSPQPAPPEPGGFFGSDGSPLTAQTISNQFPLTGWQTLFVLSGKNKKADEYQLKLETLVLAEENGVTNQPTWVFARIAMSVNGDEPLLFGFGYNPLYEQFGVSLSRGNIISGVGVDLRQLILDQNGNVTGTANLTRGLTYYTDSYGTQILAMSPNATDPSMYLPAYAILWQYLERVEFFAPALAALSQNLAPTKPTPLIALGSVRFDKWPVTQPEILADTLALAGPALGPLAAEFISFIEWPADGLREAAKWLGWVLAKGTGSQYLVTVINSYYAYYADLARTGGLGSTEPGHATILQWKDPFGYANKIATY